MTATDKGRSYDLAVIGSGGAAFAAAILRAGLVDADAAVRTKAASLAGWLLGHAGKIEANAEPGAAPDGRSKPPP